MNKSDPRWLYARILWARCVRDLFNSTCFLCRRKQGDGELFQAHHIIPCRYRHTELNVANGVLLCTPHGSDKGCHAKVEEDVGMKKVLEGRIKEQFFQWHLLIQALRQQQNGDGLGVYTKDLLERDIGILESMEVGNGNKRR